jgi:hypothetical protein
VLEPDLTAARGRLWAAVTPRLSGPLSRRRADLPADLLYPGWPRPTGRVAAGLARTARDGWRLSLPRAVIGAQLGPWSVSAGLFPATVGVGLDGDGLTLTSQAESLPQVVVRRTTPLRWSGPLRPLAPSHLLVRAGWTSAQTLHYGTEWGPQEHRATPVFSQWLLTWNHTPWWRSTVTHAALAAPRRGSTLWADLPQVNFPLLDATWNEVDHGPVTDRIFTFTTELRFRAAPWPLLPRAAGRLWWEYGGEDFRPHDDLSFLPKISAPASLAGLELVDRRWDLGLQYLETRHPLVLWYGNSSFARGYTHQDVVLGHPLGGAVEAWTALVRLRSSSLAHAWELRGRTADWRGERWMPEPGRRRELHLGWRRLAPGGHTSWSAGVGWVWETVGRGRSDWLVAQAGWVF